MLIGDKITFMNEQSQLCYDPQEVVNVVAALLEIVEIDLSSDSGAELGPAINWRWYFDC